jgi:indole-3-glycerol phosphate synthase
MKPGLKQIVDRKRSDLSKLKRSRPQQVLARGLSRALPVRNFAAALKKSGKISLIAELKKASPSAGLLRIPYDVGYGARCYAQAGVSALSILTEENYFLGDLGHIAEAKKAVSLPVLRKDFIVDPYQVYEARAAGADAVLLIVALLEDAEISDLLALTRRLGMTPLVEIHEAEELNRAVSCGAEMIGVNSRNLKDLSMNPQAFEKLVPMIPAGKIVVAESGIKTPADVKALKRLKVNAMLVGESLLKHADLEAAAKVLVQAGKK